MHGFKAILFVVIFVLAAPIPVAAHYRSDDCSLPPRTSWMDGLIVSQLFDNPHDYSWQRPWDPRYDSEWWWQYCRDRWLPR
jgi:hypothetical protein